MNVDYDSRVRIADVMQRSVECSTPSGMGPGRSGPGITARLLALFPHGEDLNCDGVLIADNGMTTEFVLPGSGAVFCGRDHKNCQIWIPDIHCSRRHAEISLDQRLALLRIVRVRIRSGGKGGKKKKCYSAIVFCVEKERTCVHVHIRFGRKSAFKIVILCVFVSLLIGGSAWAGPITCLAQLRVRFVPNCAFSFACSLRALLLAPSV